MVALRLEPREALECAGSHKRLHEVHDANSDRRPAPGRHRLSGLDAQKPRERDFKLPIGGTPGPLDAITDVAGVEVGHTTLISGSGKLVVGRARSAPA